MIVVVCRRIRGGGLGHVAVVVASEEGEGEVCCCCCVGGRGEGEGTSSSSRRGGGRVGEGATLTSCCCEWVTTRERASPSSPLRRRVVVAGRQSCVNQCQYRAHDGDLQRARTLPNLDTIFTFIFVGLVVSGVPTYYTLTVLLGLYFLL